MRARANLAAHPIHPMLVIFPLGLWITSLAFDVISSLTQNEVLWAAGFYMIIAGCIGAVLAAIPGVIDLFSVVPRNSSGRRRGYLHGSLNLLTLLLFIFIAWRRGDATAQPDVASLLLSLGGVIVVLYSGWLGGTLVYRNQIAVDHRYANAGTWKQRRLRGWDQPVCNQGELSQGQMMMAIVGNEHVVVGRCPDGYAAFSNHCTHQGGPLADGALIGCTVQCPWHGSQFDVHTGRVVTGPAEHKIHIYEVEVRSGEVYVSPNKARKSQETIKEQKKENDRAA